MPMQGKKDFDNSIRNFFNGRELEVARYGQENSDKILVHFIKGQLWPLFRRCWCVLKHQQNTGWL